MREIWKSVKGYEGLYEVSTLGRVKNSRNMILKPYDNQCGYLAIELCIDKKQKRKRLHRIIAENLISNPEGYRFVKFRDENKRNCRVDNLYWSRTADGV